MSLEVEFIKLFTELGSSSQVSDDLANGLEKFVYVLHGNKRISYRNFLRQKLSCRSSKEKISYISVSYCHTEKSRASYSACKLCR